ncbi:hypothetical protein [Streptomyces chumphonensis]|uniref:hypothetical protein n=1 Tax=Streptomyces chumphonensis TaxID=1214925 RepID=UPI003D73D245
MSTPEALLLVADHVAGRISLLDLSAGASHREVAAVEGRHISEHAGFLRLPGDRVACVDDLAGALLVLDPFAAAGGGVLESAAIPVATPAEHLAADPSGRRLAVTTGLGHADEPWSDLLTAVDLATGRACRTRVRVDEPGVTLTGGPDPRLVLRQRAPGGFALIHHSRLLAAGPGCPRVRPDATLPLPDDGHGDAYDPASDRVFTATGEGVHRARLDDGTLVAEDPLPWGGAGRGWFLRLDAPHRLLWSCLRGGPADPARWPEWTNTAWCHDLDTGLTARADLGPGLVFRMALARDHAAFTRIHPDGDELLLLTRGDGHPAVSARLPLPAMDGAPRRGGTPWDGVQRRAVAASPGGDRVAVSRGGHGEILLFDAADGRATGVLHTPTPLDEGGRLALLQAGDRAERDTVGR